MVYLRRPLSKSWFEKLSNDPTFCIFFHLCRLTESQSLGSRGRYNCCCFARMIYENGCMLFCVWNARPADVAARGRGLLSLVACCISLIQADVAGSANRNGGGASSPLLRRWNSNSVGGVDPEQARSWTRGPQVRRSSGPCGVLVSLCVSDPPVVHKYWQRRHTQRHLWDLQGPISDSLIDLSSRRLGTTMCLTCEFDAQPMETLLVLF